jgi:hypothetical protein
MQLEGIFSVKRKFSRKIEKAQIKFVVKCNHKLTDNFSFSCSFNKLGKLQYVGDSIAVKKNCRIEKNISDLFISKCNLSFLHFSR